MSASRLYDEDFYAWANEQAALLRSGRLAEADIAHIAEEIESMGKTEKRELINRLAVLLAHLLEWRFQPAIRTTSWRLTVEEQRDRLDDHMADNPSLKARLSEAIASAYRLALLGAARETGLPLQEFPAICPWSYEQIIDSMFWPDAAQNPQA
jgi:Domain of unknown function DUF29